MVRRTRLGRNGKMRNGKVRLTKSISREMRNYSDRFIKNLINTPAEIRRRDPISQIMHEEAKKESRRRDILQKEWKASAGMVSPDTFLGIMKKSFGGMKYMLDLPHRLYQGKLEADVTKATDYFITHIDDLLDRKKRATERWHQIATAHHLAKKTTTDFIKEGYDVVNRFDYDSDLGKMKSQFASYKKRYPSLIIVPTVVRNRKYYDLMVKANT